MTIDLSSLDKAVDSLGRAIGTSMDQTKMQALDKDQREVIRAGVIQNFEFTYDLCWKMLKRQLEALSASADNVDQMSFHELMRAGAEKGLIADPEKWFEYRKQRNITSHTYDEDKAESVHKTAVEFVHNARHLLARLKERNAED